MMELLMHKDPIQYGQEYNPPRLTTIKPDDIPPLLRIVYNYNELYPDKSTFSSIIQTYFAPKIFPKKDEW